MTTELLSRRTVVVSWLLNSLCLRYGVAKPSVWLCRKACKLRQFNGFGSDYPLTLVVLGSSIGVFLSTCMCRGFSLRFWRPFVVSTRYLGPGRGSGKYCWLTWNDLGGGALIRIHRHSLPCRESSAARGLPFRTCRTVPLTATSYAPCSARMVG